MTYTETVEYLFNSTPMFQNVGSAGYKEGLDNTITLDNHFDNPHNKFKTIHIGGTNGKGSCSHTIAAILQSAGYKVGLFTSPHLVDFRERIRINGVMIPEQYVIDFVENEKDFFEPLHPSFFELTTALAFKYFAENNVDIAVIEVGLGGRLDCTNIISPILSVITNIGFDHIQFLGNTLEKIASEKAGIIKNNTPAVIGETTPETRTVFIQKATSTNSAIYLAEENDIILSHQHSHNGGIDYETKTYGTIHGELSGLCQIKNTATILTAINVLAKIGLAIQPENIIEGFKHV
ncbi:MAG: bifunctional folylpolyglutamate synthase/dihydrofolate synthase, partial [Paludibacteraceae bacterium]|nr:bifunctional folylpolyglutamate synthase/dihydrofolate synthase [Paludibacteraceae bacterium]